MSNFVLFVSVILRNSRKDKRQSMTAFSILKGCTFDSIVVSKTSDGDDVIIFSNEHEEYQLLHSQDCCESVYIEDIPGVLTEDNS